MNNPRKVRYAVAVSLDGFIAGPNGEADWITIDESMDFVSFFKEFDTLLIGRRTFQVAHSAQGPAMLGMKVIVCSRTLSPKDFPDVTISNDAAATVAALKGQPGKDIWLFGGGDLFRSLLDARCIDRIELGVMPVMLSEGIPLLPKGWRSPNLRLVESKTLPSGTVGLTYAPSYATDE